MTLWEAIRQLKEGQGIEQYGLWLAKWGHGESKPDLVVSQVSQFDLLAPATIIDLPRPVTLYDVLVEGAHSKAIKAECGSCNFQRADRCYSHCSRGLIDTLQSIALAQGFDLKKVVK